MFEEHFVLTSRINKKIHSGAGTSYLGQAYLKQKKLKCLVSIDLFDYKLSSESKSILEKFDFRISLEYFDRRFLA